MTMYMRHSPEPPPYLLSTAELVKSEPKRMSQTPKKMLIGPRAEAVSRHEAGHFIMGHLNQFRMSSYWIKAPYQGQERGDIRQILDEALGTFDAVQNYLRRRVQVLFAGAIAETMDAEGNTTEQKVQECFQAVSATEHAILAELMHVSINITFKDVEKPNATAAYHGLYQEIFGEVCACMKKNHAAVTAIATEVLRHMNAKKTNEIEFKAQEITELLKHHGITLHP
jgi:hypothetical protein